MPKKHLFYTRTHNRCRTPQMEGMESLSASCGGQSVAQGWHDDREGARGFTPARSAVAPFNPGEKTRRRHPRGSAWSPQPPNRHNGDHATPALKLSGERMDLRQSFRFAGQTEGRRNSSGDVRRRQSTIPERGSVCKTVGHRTRSGLATLQGPSLRCTDGLGELEGRPALPAFSAFCVDLRTSETEPVSPDTRPQVDV